MALTPKQEAFAVGFFTHGIAAKAYREAYDVAPDAKDHWIYVEAGQLLDHPEISLRLQELKEQAARHAIFTRQSAMDELEEARQAGLKLGMPAAAVSATNSKIKLWGLEAPKKIAATHSNPDGTQLAPALDVSKLSSAALHEVLGAMNEAESNEG